MSKGSRLHAGQDCRQPWRIPRVLPKLPQSTKWKAGTVGCETSLLSDYRGQSCAHSLLEPLMDKSYDDVSAHFATSRHQHTSCMLWLRVWPVSRERRVTSFSVVRVTQSSHGKPKRLWRRRHRSGAPSAFRTPRLAHGCERVALRIWLLSRKNSSMRRRRRSSLP